MTLIDPYKVGMCKFFHDLNFFESSITFERIHVYSLECIRLFFDIFDEINTAETSLAYDVDGFVVMKGH